MSDKSESSVYSKDPRTLKKIRVKAEEAGHLALMRPIYRKSCGA
jgi:hypothetical protein